MTSLITWWTKDGKVHYCDAHCYNGKREARWCHCACAGANHGAGEHDAVIRTRAFAVQWMAKREDVTAWTVPKGITFKRPEWGTEDPRYFRSLNKNERYWKRHPNYQGPAQGRQDDAGQS